MRFPHERVAQFVCSFGASDRAHYELIGTEGYMTLDNAYDYNAEMTMHVSGKHGEKHRTFERRDQIAAEIEYFARCVRDDVDPEWSEQTVKLAQLTRVARCQHETRNA